MKHDRFMQIFQSSGNSITSRQLQDAKDLFRCLFPSGSVAEEVLYLRQEQCLDWADIEKRLNLLSGEAVNMHKAIEECIALCIAASLDDTNDEQLMIVPVEEPDTDILKKLEKKFDRREKLNYNIKHDYPLFEEN